MPGYTDAQRRARNKYQKTNYVVCSAKLKKEDADALRAALEKEGQTVNGFLTACAMDYINELRTACGKTLGQSAPDQPPDKTE